jgi:mannose/fructose-specific phosphotransferase system component IIA
MELEMNDEKQYVMSGRNLKMLITLLLSFMTEEQLMRVDKLFEEKGLNIKDFTD